MHKLFYTNIFADVELLANKYVPATKSSVAENGVAFFGLKGRPRLYVYVDTLKKGQLLNLDQHFFKLT